MNTIATPVDLGVIEKLREEELEEARSLQSGMLPVEPLWAGGVRISHEFQPIAEVGRDFLDYFEMTDGCIGLYLGDVSGKGLPAAMYAALAVAARRSQNGAIAWECAVRAESAADASRRIAAARGNAIRPLRPAYPGDANREHRHAGTFSLVPARLPRDGNPRDTAGAIRSVGGLRHLKD
jgi:hypothetical protein